jgi:hypothetical protein
MLCPFVPEMATNTRTTLTTRLVRYYGWNMSFHAEHHLAPALRFTPCRPPTANSDRGLQWWHRGMRTSYRSYGPQPRARPASL